MPNPAWTASGGAPAQSEGGNKAVQQFFAILKDSYREAVDGFVIYVMLGLSAVLIAIAASMSFTPVPPEDAFSAIVPQFNLIVPDKGRSSAISLEDRNTFKASDVETAGGGYKLRLTVTATTERSREFDPVEAAGGKSDRPKGDSFRSAVARWSAVTGETVRVDEKGKVTKNKGAKGIDVAVPTQFTVAEQRAVTDGQMEEFLKSQFVMHADMSATVTRSKSGEEPVYAFDVTTTGGSAVKGWPHATKLFFGAATLADNAPLGGTLWLIEDVVISRFGGTFTLLIGMIITSFFIPNMLRKGSVDLLISKPVSRSKLLVFKYIGGLTFMFLVTAFTVGGIWFVLAVRSGFWDPSFLVAIPVLTFTFASLYALSTLTATFTRSAIAAMLISIGFAFFLVVFGQIKAASDSDKVEHPNSEPSFLQTYVVDLGHDALPRTRELDQLVRRAISSGTLTPSARKLLIRTEDTPSLAGTFGMSLFHIAWMLGVSCWWFSRRDY